MKRTFRLSILSLLCVIASAQTVVVTRNVNLRPDASTDNGPIETLKPGAQLTLIDPAPTDGYHVKAPDKRYALGLINTAEIVVYEPKGHSCRVIFKPSWEKLGTGSLIRLPQSCINPFAHAA